MSLPGYLAAKDWSCRIFVTMQAKTSFPAGWKSSATNPTPRLNHWFSKADCAAVEDDLGLNTTCVIIFEHAKAELETAGTDRLTYLGSFVALRHRP